MTSHDSAMQGSRSGSQTEVSGWAVGFIVMAAVLMITGGIFHFIEGLAAIINDDQFILGFNYAYDVSVSTWGWVHLVIGVVMALAGLALFSGAMWARMVAVLIAVLSAIVNFVFIPYYPIWSLVMLVICAGVIWAVIAHGGEMKEAQ